LFWIVFCCELNYSNSFGVFACVWLCVSLCYDVWWWICVRVFMQI